MLIVAELFMPSIWIKQLYEVREEYKITSDAKYDLHLRRLHWGLVTPFQVLAS